MTAHAPASDFAFLDDNPAPPGLKAVEVTTADRVRLRCAVSAPKDGPARGTVLILQGRNETIEKYFETMADLNRRGFMVATFDWHGQGGSGSRPAKGERGGPPRPGDGRRPGYVRRFKGYLDDLEAVIHDLLLPDCRPPYAILAHSSGALVALSASERLTNRIERMVLSGPFVALPPGSPPLSLMRFAALTLRLLGFGRLPVRRAVLPGNLGTPAENPLTHDPRRFARNRHLAESHPELFVGPPTVGWLAAVTGAMRRLQHSDVVARLSIPTLFVCAGGDRVVSTPAAEQLAWRMRTASSLTLPGARHELLQEADRHREPLLAALETFLSEALPLPASTDADRENGGADDHSHARSSAEAAE